ncbi:retinol dehydrogenase 12-like [Mercenaria mercenaria]|uniref:retinol dehydrogenase 12-like n=1 Tax=Mercenaria mercenaria TaxID=6596 RepID=UPI00234F2CC6|nr:retinol dehydrogenase 12-like [Mercenaria mercenaria]XP_045169155.2 retinol dehydrogenase 12-like [Mercenaria mercenaria]XP_045169163.2 retinol dehydrogenase 12-like [Mercenaria mercenaria]XP_053408946.1 retinol dehydrogenase 12-like [Mercenaria mercenaria]XP_053408948.1 retinol dehydrogenase 12-like [Mercenaria mercenaria]
MSWKGHVQNAALCVGIAGVTLLAVRRAVLYIRTRCPSRVLMLGKTVIVTGANCGIGYETALDLAGRKARVILACRDLSKAQSAATKISKITGNTEVLAKKLDLASLKSVREFCSDVNANEQKLDVLINNAGVMNCPYSVTEDGFENHLAVNHFGNFLLTNLLKDLLYKAEDSRVVFVSSALHKYGKVKLENLNSEENYKQGKPYGDSKLMNLLFAREFHKRFANDGKICVYSMHPGMVRTRLGRHTILFNRYFQIFGFPVYALLYSLYFLLIKSAREGCQTVVYCAVAPELQGQSDGYYGNFKKEPWSKPASDLDLAKKVWEISEKLTML